MEELGRVDSSVAVTLSVASGLAGGMVTRFGTVAQKERWLPQIAAGEMLAGFALTEPSGGSDIKALRTTARLTDGTWTIDGSKSFITNSGTPITGFLVVACRTDEPPRRNRVAAVLATILSCHPVNRRVEMRAGMFPETKRVPVPRRPALVVSRDHVDGHAWRRGEDRRQADHRRLGSKRLTEIDDAQAACGEIVNELAERGRHGSDTSEIRTGSRAATGR